MAWRAIVLVAAACLAAGSAFAKEKPCRSEGAKNPVVLEFPRQNSTDVDIARASLVPISAAHELPIPTKLTCWRADVSTRAGDFEIGGSNADAYPRIARKLKNPAGPSVVLVPIKVSDAQTIYGLVVRYLDGVIVLKRYYTDIPGNPELIFAVILALADNSGLVTLNPKMNTVSYGFLPDGGLPPPVQGKQQIAGGATLEAASPQVMISDTAGPPATFLEVTPNGMRHKSSGFACPMTFRGLPVLINYIDPSANGMACNYRAGTDLAHVPNAPIRYQLSIDRVPGVSSQEVFDQLVAQAQTAFKIDGARKPPVEAGLPPQPEHAGYWNTETGEAQGVWLLKTGDWLVRVRSQFPASADNHAEAARVVATLFAFVAIQMKPPAAQPVSTEAAARPNTP